MPRANRIFDKYSVWHLTHRCHNKQFLLKFQKDRLCWRFWLFEATRRYGLSVLNYIVTSNHVHLMVYSSDKKTIPLSMRLIAGRTAQAYNRRKQRRGAFWEDRYHAVPIRTETHFSECLVYVDLNMVRAGVVTHPSQWGTAGYNEIQKPRQRYVVIDYPRLAGLAGASTPSDLRRIHHDWVETRLQQGPVEREERWTDFTALDSHFCSKKEI